MSGAALDRFMANCRLLIVSLLPLLLGACTTVQVGTELQTGRTALIAGKPEVALAHFRRAAEADPNYIHHSPLQESVWTYVGRAYYDQARLPEAGEALKRALGRNEKDFVARLYLGLTLLRISNTAVSDDFLSLEQIAYALKERVTPKRVASMVKERGIRFALTEAMEKDLLRLGADNALVEELRAKSAGLVLPEQGLEEIRQSLREIDGWLESMTGTAEGRFWDPGKTIRTQVKASLAMMTAKQINQKELISSGEWLGKALEEEIDLARRDEREQMKRRQTR